MKERLFAKSGTRQQQSQETLESDKAYSLVLEQFEANNCGGFRCVYPCVNEHKYKPFFQQSGSLFTETVSLTIENDSTTTLGRSSNVPKHP